MNLLEALYPRPNGSDGRESKTWWIVDKGSVSQSLGWSCEPNNPDYWWFPDYGYSVPENHLYETRPQAVEAARAELYEKLSKLA